MIEAQDADFDRGDTRGVEDLRCEDGLCEVFCAEDLVYMQSKAPVNHLEG